MSYAIGIDLGTTSLSALILNLADGGIVVQRTLPHGALSSPSAGRAELDLGRVLALLAAAVQEMLAANPGCAQEVRCIGVTGQQHGLALLDGLGRPVAPAITWQDQRGEELMPESDESYVRRLIALAGGPPAFERMGCLPATGYLGVTLFWLAQHQALDAGVAQVGLIPDAAVTYLTGHAVATDPTNGGSSGLLDIHARDWDWEIMDRLRLPRGLFPLIAEAGSPAGTLRADLARRWGLPNEIPVGVALGDNQASFLGSVRRPAESVLVNIGTGGQVSAWVPEPARLDDFDTRCFPGGGYLLVGATLYGGATYAAWRGFLRDVGVAFFGATGQEELYDRMTELAGAVASGAEGVRCNPLFAGTRADPAARGGFAGLTTATLTPAHLTRALLEGMADGYHALYARMRPIIGERALLVGSGNALARNPLLARLVSERFGRPMHLAPAAEAAALGAALTAAVGCGALPGFEAAARLLG
jgi:sedoheptulokinase